MLKGVNLLLSAVSQQADDIEKSSLPTTLCTETAHGQEVTLDSGEIRGTLSGEHITFETPPISQGELPKSSLQATSLPESTSQIYSQ